MIVLTYYPWGIVWKCKLFQIFSSVFNIYETNVSELILFVNSEVMNEVPSDAQLLFSAFNSALASSYVKTIALTVVFYHAFLKQKLAHKNSKSV